LRKGIANTFNKATPFCNALTPANVGFVLGCTDGRLRKPHHEITINRNPTAL
jgi:hypothetical protein